jgi:hypothetical protein
MKLFGRKNTKMGRATEKGSPRSPAREANLAAHNGHASHRITKDLERAETLAAMLAQSRSAETVEVADLLAGMYIYDWERLSKFWDEGSQDAIEDYLQQICRISPQRWHQWIEHYDQQRRKEEPRKRKLWQFLPPKGEKAAAKPLGQSGELQRVLKRAEALSPARDFVEGRAIPILTCECVLLAIAQKTDSEIGHRLVSTGLDVGTLEQSARNPKHAPRH